MEIGKIPSSVKNALIDNDRINKSSNKIIEMPIRIKAKDLKSKL